MCRRHERKDQDALVDSKELFSPYDDDINRFFDKVNLVTSNLADITKKFVGSTYDYANSTDFPQWKDRMESKATESIDSYVNRPYQTRDQDLVSDGPFNAPFRTPFDIFNVFGSSGGRTPFGIYSYKGPSTREYNDCLRKDGVSVWDSEGYWRCLFPNSEVPARLLDYKKNHLDGQILTKEDFTDAVREHKPSGDEVIDLGPKGVFFKQFTGYLNWKNAMYENARKQREDTRKKIRESFSKPPADQASGDRAVVSSSVVSSMNSDYDTKEVVLRETKTEVFSDGTAVTKNITKTKPFGAREWVSVNEDVQTEDNKNGWFWNSK